MSCSSVASLRSWRYSGTPLIRSPMGQKSLALLTSDGINEGFFTRKCVVVLPGGQKKVAVITRWPYYRGGRKAGFHCIVSVREDKKFWRRSRDPRPKKREWGRGVCISRGLRRSWQASPPNITRLLTQYRQLRRLFSRNSQLRCRWSSCMA